MNNILYSEIKRIAPNPATFVIQMCVGGWRDGSRLTCDNDYFTVGRVVTIIRMVKFFIQLYSSNDYFVWFY